MKRIVIKLMLLLLCIIPAATAASDIDVYQSARTENDFSATAMGAPLA